MIQIEKSQIRDIYALGASLGIVERGCHDDALHQLVSGITGKDGVSELSKAEAEQVLTELMNRMRLVNHPITAQRIRKPRDTVGGMTAGQQQKVWYLMYQLRDLDIAPSKATLGERLCGIIKKELDLDAMPKEPFKWMDHTQGRRLIDVLKKYVDNTSRKRARG